MKTQREKAEEFRALHTGKHILVLPNAWDAASARVFENEGFPAVATSSAGLMVSLGYPDGESIPFREFLGAVKRISRVVSVPLTVDAVSGFGHSAAEVALSVKDILEAGAVGINIEDFDHSTKKLHPVEKQLEKIAAIRKVGALVDVPLVINARTDALRLAEEDEHSRLDEAIMRATAYRDGGADCVYPMGLVKSEDIATFTKALKFPLNVMVRKGLPRARDLEKLGVARLSFGPSASCAAMGLLKRAAKEIKEKGTYETLIENAVTFDELNSLALPHPAEDIDNS